MKLVTDGVWVDEGPVSIVGMPLTSTMTVLRVDRALVLVSPLPMTPERRAAIDALGTVAHLYAPNTFHHMWLGAWADAYPSARVHAPAGLRSKRPDLRIDHVHGEGAIEGVHEIAIDGFRLEESALVHAPTSTVVVTDLFHNIGRPDHLWTKIYAGLGGFYGRVAMSGVLRLTAFSDKRAARRSVDAILDHAIERIVVGHGAPVIADAREAMIDATRWMPAASPAPKQLASGARPSPMWMPRPCG